MSHDTLIHRLVRPCVRMAAPSGVTPNQLTTARLVTALAAAAAFATGAPLWIGIGAGVFLFSFLLDRADGELARQTGQCSPGGHQYDLVSDCTANAIALFGLGAGQTDALGAMGPVLGLLAGSGVGVLFWILNILRDTPVSGFSLAEGRLVLDPDDAMIFLPMLLWLGLATPVLITAALATPLAALWLGVSTLLATRRSGRAPAP